MKIAFTGTSSTGKTTLAVRLIKNPEFTSKVPEFVAVDARALLDELGFRSMDKMTRGQSREFQQLYFRRKIEIESGRESFLTDRSFVDIAAYWVCRDTFDLSEAEQRLLLDPCRHATKKYDIHFYFPSGLIVFEHDGYRSDDIEFHMRIDRCILRYLVEWQIPYVTIVESDINKRIETVLGVVKDLRP